MKLKRVKDLSYSDMKAMVAGNNENPTCICHFICDRDDMRQEQISYVYATVYRREAQE